MRDKEFEWPPLELNDKPGFPRVNSLHNTQPASHSVETLLGLLCDQRRQGDSESACQPVMRSLDQTSESHDRSDEAAFFWELEAFVIQQGQRSCV